MKGYEFHPEALSDLDEIWEFVHIDNPGAADRVIAEILSRIRALVTLPNQGHKRPDLTSRPLRFVRVREYLIAYASDQEPLSIIAVLHGRRNPRVLAAILRSRG